MEKKKIVSIFSGIDCLGLGFRKYFDIVLAVEKEKIACEVLNLNKEEFHNNLNVINADIKTIPDSEIEKYIGVEGLIGGPPCTPFSTARGAFDIHNKDINCIFEYVKWVSIIRPNFFVFENVKGLLDVNKLPIFELFLDMIEELDYEVEYKVVNSHDYGNAQKRERLIVVGFKKELNKKFIFDKPVVAKKYVRDILDEPGLVGEYDDIRDRIIEIMPHIPEGGNWRSLKSDYLLQLALGKNYKNRAGGMTGVCRRLHRDKPSPTLLTHPGYNTTLLAHPLEDRLLSVTEYKRGQGIPDNYKLIGNVKQKYRYIGNGVPVELASYIAKSIYDILYS